MSVPFESWCDLDWDSRRGLWVASLFFQLDRGRREFVSFRDPNPYTALACVYKHALDFWVPRHAAR